MAEPDLERRLRLVEDELAIMRTFSRYSHAVGYGGDFADIFTDDAVLEVRTRDNEVMHRNEGVAAIQAYMDARKFPPERFDKVVLLAPIIEASDDRATATSFFVLFTDARSGLVGAVGRYMDALVKQHGSWLIKERIGITEVVSSD